MSTESTLKTTIKTFAAEAERFKIDDLAGLLKQPPKLVLKLMKKMVEQGELQGAFTSKNDEFVTAERLKTEIIRVLKNPRILNNNM